MIGAVDWTAVSALLGEAAAVLAAVVKLLVSVSRLEAAVREHRERLDQNARHLDSNINSSWMVTMRVATMEDHLARTTDYHPPILYPRNQQSDGGD